MCAQEINEANKKIEVIISKYINKKGALMMIIQDIQDTFGYISMENQEYVANKMAIPLTEIYGIVTFYSQFSEDPRGENTISVCMGTACYVKNAPGVLEEVKKELKISDGETTSDNKFSLVETRCLGTCGLAPVMQINDQVFGKMTPEKVKAILIKY